MRVGARTCVCVYILGSDHLLAPTSTPPSPSPLKVNGASELVRAWEMFIGGAFAATLKWQGLSVQLGGCNSAQAVETLKNKSVGKCAKLLPGESQGNEY